MCTERKRAQCTTANRIHLNALCTCIERTIQGKMLVRPLLPLTFAYTHTHKLWALQDEHCIRCCWRSHYVNTRAYWIFLRKTHRALFRCHLSTHQIGALFSFDFDDSCIRCTIPLQKKMKKKKQNLKEIMICKRTFLKYYWKFWIFS